MEFYPAPPEDMIHVTVLSRSARGQFFPAPAPPEDKLVLLVTGENRDPRPLSTFLSCGPVVRSQERRC